MLSAETRPPRSKPLRTRACTQALLQFSFARDLRFTAASVDANVYTLMIPTPVHAQSTERARRGVWARERKR
eukprot:3671813-Pleurochrysis_carterae.AAC.1